MEPDLKLAVLPGGVDAGVVTLLDPRRMMVMVSEISSLHFFGLVKLTV